MALSPKQIRNKIPDPLARMDIREVTQKSDTKYAKAKRQVELAITEEGFRADGRVFGAGSKETRRFTREEWLNELRSRGCYAQLSG